METQLQEEISRLLNEKFALVDRRAPDPKHFGNWCFVVTRDNLAVCITKDRSDLLLDLMPRQHYEAGPPNWYNWDVVARALGWQSEGPDPLQDFLDHASVIDEAFAPSRWEETAAILAKVEEEKRRRFTEGRRVPAHA